MHMKIHYTHMHIAYLYSICIIYIQALILYYGYLFVLHFVTFSLYNLRVKKKSKNFLRNFSKKLRIQNFFWDLRLIDGKLVSRTDNLYIEIMSAI